jgi:hypothetical protein
MRHPAAGQCNRRCPRGQDGRRIDAAITGVVTANGDTLTIAVGPAGRSAQLTPYNGDVFSWVPPGDAGEPLSAVRFDADEPAQTVTLDFLNGIGLGTFTRS